MNVNFNQVIIDVRNQKKLIFEIEAEEVVSSSHPPCDHVVIANPTSFCGLYSILYLFSLYICNNKKKIRM